jgi:transposase
MGFIRKIKVGGKTYLAEVKSVREGKKVRQEFIRYVGREVNGKRMLSGSTENIEVLDVKIWAPLLILDRLAKEIQLSELLGEYGKYLLSMVYAHCIEPKSLNAMEEWFKRTDLQNMLHINDVSEKKLYNALDSINEKNIEPIQKNIFNTVKHKYNLEPKGYFFDVTNVYFYGTECSIAKKGHNKEGTYRPQVQIGLAVTRNEGIPIFHKTFEGNIFDAKIMNDILTSFHDVEIKDTFIIWDRGVTSENNILEAKRHGFHVICGVPIKQGLKKTVEEITNKAHIIQLKNRVRLKNTVLYCHKQQYIYGTIRGQIVLCYNEETARINREKRIDSLEKVKKDIDAGKPLPEDIRQYFTGKEINEKILHEKQKYDGYTVIFSTKELPVEQIVKPYFEKDKVEKAFRSMKSILGLKPIRHWLEERVKAHIFVCYISYLLLSLLEYKLKSLNISPTIALNKLSTAYKINLKNNKLKKEFTKTVTLTKEQEKIMKLVDKKILKCSD